MWPFDRPPADELAPGTSLVEATANAHLVGEDEDDLVPSDIDGVAPEPDEQRGALLGTVSGLSRAHAHKATNMALQAAVLAYHHRSQVHYTQGSRRWEGISRHRKGWRGEYPNYCDCSAFVTWAVWNGCDHFHTRDVVNHLRWQSGWTGSMFHGRAVRTPFPGCAVIYGPGPGSHTALYTGGGLVVSHGSERGPLLVPMHYRSDIHSIRSYIY